MTETDRTSAEAFVVAFRCPRCGGPLAAPAAGKLACEYCGTAFLPRELLGARAVDLQQFYERAFEAMAAGDYGRAYEYFSRIVEGDPSDYQAWLGRGVAGAYAAFADTQLLNAGEVVSCADMALARYGGEDRAAFATSLADRVGALARDLFLRVNEGNANDERNLNACLELLRYWERNGTDEFGAWKSIVEVAQTPAIPPKSERDPGSRYLTFDYPLRAVAETYAARIREKYEPAFKNVFERGAETRREIAKSLKEVGVVLVAALAAVVAVILLVAAALFGLGLFGFTYFR
jgi:hypothetical protein